MPLLDVRNLTVSFHTYLGKVEAVRDVSFTLEEGETLAIVGESGCGKSVTAQSLIRLVPTPPGKFEGGEIYFGEKELLSASRKEMEKIRGREIGMVFQDPMTALNPTMRVGKQIAEGIRKHLGLNLRNARCQALQMLNLVGINDPEKRMEQYPHELSGGMRQRICISLALACQPKLLIADEPTTALDVTIQAQILELMQAIQKKMGTSIILITHDLGIVAGMCDRVLVMYGGKVIEQGTVEEIYYSPKHPYTKGLLASVPRLDMEKKKSLSAIDGTPPQLLKPPKGCLFCPRCSSAMRICPEKTPPLKEVSSTHQYSCWLGEKP
ncbi:MAG: Oligopeptide transport ATP-binding protein OppD [Chlamydiae bacterium]|nr:Oligopeptide transport ATP-binding protein OppD [Chlamydiota bacterium]